MSSLLNMPDIVLSKILEKCDFVSILILRKTCHDLRNFIDDTKPVQSIYEIHVFGFSDFISMKIVVGGQAKKKYPNGDSIVINYCKHPYGSEIIWKRSDKDRERISEGLRYIDRFSIDIDNILNYRMPILDKFEFIGLLKVSVLNKIRESLKSRRRLLRVRHLTIIGDDEDEILEVLPYICPKSLKTLEVRRNTMDKITKIDKLTKLEQWKNSENLVCHWNKVLPPPIQNFTHFTTVSITFDRFMADSVKFLKEHFLNSTSTSKHFLLRSHQYSSEDQLTKVLGPPSITSIYYMMRKLEWFFKSLKNPDYALQITYLPYFVEMEFVHMAQVPAGVTIIG